MEASCHINYRNWRGEKINQGAETQVVDTLPEHESQEQDPATEQVCRENPPSEKNLDTC